MPCKSAPTFEVTSMPTLSTYTAIVTGGNSGVGYETALNLALHGARVYIASRSSERVRDAINKMKSSHGGQTLDLHYLHLDLMSLKSVKAAADEFMSKETKLDLLFNNAGVMAIPYQVTEDGFDAQLQVNGLAHHLLTLYLLPVLRAAVTANHPPNHRVRVIFVSSNAAFLVKSISYSDPNMSQTAGWSANWKRYANSKLTCILLAHALHTHFYSSFSIAFYAVHPGIIKTNLQTGDPTFLGMLVRASMHLPGPVSPLEGAKNSLFCATSPDAVLLSGKYLEPVGKVVGSADKFFNDPEEMNKVWGWANGMLTERGFEIKEFMG
ncbi:MAG: hypothetical protein M1834_009240 [Cirrosporium novae-zelandiae]|nr:MAG: hypothetical protein M1834_009240 [Cirrosporium novae-zelandiae]